MIFSTPSIFIKNVIDVNKKQIYHMAIISNINNKNNEFKFCLNNKNDTQFYVIFDKNFTKTPKTNCIIYQKPLKVFVIYNKN
jgi:hypothetical protein